MNKTTVKWSNLFAGTPVSVLFYFGVAEGIIAIVQAAEWVSDYPWLYRLLPIAAFVLSQFKLFINNEVIGAKQTVTVEGPADAELTVTKTSEPKLPE
jgi:hypothetical protein